LDELRRDEEVAQTRFEEALDELEAMHIRCIDVVKGIVWLPFARGEQLAWIIFDLFATEKLVGWRFDSDPPSIRRNMALRTEASLSSRLATEQVDLLMARDGRVTDDGLQGFEEQR
jgi:hypothetical protein